MSDRDEANHTEHRCSKSRPCGRWRTCYFCARRRQARVADATQRLFERCGELRWHILYPIYPGQRAMQACRENWLKKARPEGAIWTIEQSSKTGALHCNLITPSKITHAPLDAQHWQRIIRGEARAVGAYIAKQRQMPRAKDYSGRLYGTSGRLWQYLTGSDALPLVAAAATQYALDSHAMIDRAASLLWSPSERNKRKWAQQEYEEKAAAVMPIEEARRIAAKWLPDLLAWKEKNRPRSSLEIARKFYDKEGNI
ncbi:MAG: hypothetical protein WC825_06035 [Gallionellaceae bacterium]